MTVRNELHFAVDRLPEDQVPEALTQIREPSDVQTDETWPPPRVGSTTSEAGSVTSADGLVDLGREGAELGRGARIAGSGPVNVGADAPVHRRRERGSSTRFPYEVRGRGRLGSALADARAPVDGRGGILLSEVVPVATPENEPAAWVPGQADPAERLSVAELAGRLGVEPVRDVAELRGLARPELWDSEEDYEEFLSDLYDSRRAGMS